MNASGTLRTSGMARKLWSSIWLMDVGVLVCLMLSGLYQVLNADRVLGLTVLVGSAALLSGVVLNRIAAFQLLGVGFLATALGLAVIQWVPPPEAAGRSLGDTESTIALVALLVLFAGNIMLARDALRRRTLVR